MLLQSQITRRTRSLLTLWMLLLILGCSYTQDSNTQSLEKTTPTTTDETVATNQKAEPVNEIANTQQLLQIASSDLKTGDFSAARETLKQVLLREPSNLDAKLLLVATQAQQAQFAEALDGLRELVQTFPDRLEIRRGLANMLNARGFRYEANENLRFLAARRSLSVRELAGLINPMKTWSDFPEKPDVDDQALFDREGVLNTIAALRANGDYRDALTILQRSRLLKQKDPVALAAEGWLLSLNQDRETLQQWAISVPDQCKDTPAYWLAMGDLLAQDNTPLAKECYLSALAREPSCGAALDGLVVCYSKAPDSQTLDRLKKRQELFSESKALARELSTRRRSDLSLAAEMGRVLNEMGRLVESLAWQEAVIESVSPQAPQLTILREHKAKVLNRYPSGVNEAEVLCGLKQPDTAKLRSDLAAWRTRSQPGSRSPAHPAPKISATPSSQPKLINRADRLGLSFRYLNSDVVIEKHFRLFEPLGGGIACLDFDLDGYVDLYAGQAHSKPPRRTGTSSNQLFRNLDSQFERVTNASATTEFGYTHGVTAGDLNQDGWPDLVVSNVGENHVFLNQGDGTFAKKEMSSTGEWSDGKVSLSVAIADVNGDSLPDIFETVYVDDPRVFDPIRYNQDGTPIQLPGPKQFAAGKDRLFVCKKDGSFQKVSLGENSATASTGMGLIVTDLDNDRRNEIFVANDQNANQLWTQSESGDFPSWIETAPTSGCAYGAGGKAFACMGISAADFDSNGSIDLHVTNFVGESSNLYLQQSPSQFSDQAVRYQLDSSTSPMVAFGTQTLDYDNNTSPDLIIANGHIEDFRAKGKAFRMPTQLLAFDGRQFLQHSDAGDPSYWNKDRLGRAVAKLDWNRDGLVDVAITHLFDPLALLENQTETSGGFVQLQLIGSASERDCIGARVTLLSGDRSFVQVVQAGDGYLCKNEHVLFFGLGDADSVDSVTIAWPSGLDQTFNEVPINSRTMIIEGQANHWPCW